MPVELVFGINYFLFVGYSEYWDGFGDFSVTRFRAKGTYAAKSFVLTLVYGAFIIHLFFFFY
jgi:hypothetical protein